MKTPHILTALIAGIALTATDSAQAVLIYSGVQNVPIAQNFEGVYLHLTDGATALTFPADWNTEPWLNPFFGGVDVGNSPLLRPVITGTDQILNLAPGTVIDASSNFVAGESGSSTHVGIAANQFHVGTPGILGFAFETTVGGPDYYGWVRMNVDNVGTGSIVDWAYESTAGTAIQAGQITGVPEPATFLAGLACAAVGLASRKRPRPAKQ